jgi:DNA-binding CsgD family transcriptional regulator
MAERPAVDTTLLERDPELEAIGGALGDAAARTGGVLAVEGPAGIGKSSLLDEACAEASARGMRVLCARGSESEREFGFGCVLQWLERPLASAAPEERQVLLAGSAGLAATVLGLGDAAPGGEASFAALHGLYWLCANLCERQPLLLALDDAHWADAASLRFIDYLAARLEGTAIALAVAWRDDEPGADLGPLERVTAAAGNRRLHPGPLSAAASAELVRERLGPDSSEQLCAACHEASAGNPLLLTELTRALAQLPHAERLGPAAVAEQRSPAVSRLVGSRLTRLGDDATGLAQAVAVLGDSASIPSAARLAGLGADAARASADALRGAGILEPQHRLAFVHPLVRASVEETIPTGKRAERHRQAARLREDEGASPERIAQHLLMANPSGDPWSVRVLRRAAGAAGARGASEAAVRYLRRALEEPPRAGERAPLLMELGLAEVSAQEPEGPSHLEQAIDETGDPELRARCALALARLGLLEADGARGVAIADRGLAALGDSESELALALQAEAIGAHLYALHPIEELAGRVQRVEAAAGCAESAVERWLLALITCMRMAQGKITAKETVALAERALRDRLLLEEFGPDSPTHPWPVNMLVMVGRPERALPHYADGLEEAGRRGSALGMAIYLSLRPMAHLGRGDLVSAETDVAMALDAPGARPLAAGPGLLAAALAEQGRIGEAQSVISAIPLPEDGVARDGQLCLLQSLRGRVRIAAGEVEAGVNDMLQVGERYEAAGFRTANLPTGSWRPHAVRGLAGLGRSEQAREIADRELGAVRDFESPASLGVALHAAASLESGGEAAELLRESVEALERSEDRLSLARSLVDLGATLRRLGHRRDARDPLRRGLDLAHRCAAHPLVDRSLEELRSAGARPRRPRMTGREALTPQERRISEMASGGITNREIAQALFLTLRTVEMHLSNAYGKLGISSRKALADALGDDGS